MITPYMSNSQQFPSAPRGIEVQEAHIIPTKEYPVVVSLYGLSGAATHSQ